MEAVLTIVCIIFGIMVGTMIGIFIGVGRMQKAVEESSVGNLRIDQSEPDEPPRPFLEITKGASIELISERKFVILKVIRENYVSSN